MMTEKWDITIFVYRQKQDQKGFYQAFKLEVDPDEYVLDAVERIWAFHDRSLCYRHACHHSTCGACGMLVNGVEKLTCITPIRSVTKNNGTIKLAPLRNFPVVSDLAVDMGSFYANMEAANARQVLPLSNASLPHEKQTRPDSFERLSDCIECGMCISACPVALTTEKYIGPGVLAAIEQNLRLDKDAPEICLADDADGVWRCHSAFECSEVCPSNVDPGWRIMDLRRQVLINRIQSIFRIRKEA
jgi:succinate dehydrogenase / fumarate reductase iron-sulfur subunit